ncbi:E3 ubiquitin-protein ligase rnf19b, partial [Balamuthia mandrillaris]
VICTQPRKLAAISLAERVAFEFSAGNPKFSRVGGTVGYRVSGIRKTSRRTRIEYTTESSLLLQLNENTKK